MNVLSLFDGMSCGQLALNRLGIKYENYFASEIDIHAIKIALKNYPNTIQIGDDRAKPTDIWTNSLTWKPKPSCHNGNKNCHHAPAPRGSRTGT